MGGCERHDAPGCSCDTPEHDLTPSEVALARVLAAWEAWPGTTGIESDVTEGALIELSGVLSDFGFIIIQEGTEDPAMGGDAAALLARARKAGVL